MQKSKEFKTLDSAMEKLRRLHEIRWKFEEQRPASGHITAYPGELVTLQPKPAPHPAIPPPGALND